jgi:hypothetical protein
MQRARTGPQTFTRERRRPYARQTLVFCGLLCLPDSSAAQSRSNLLPRTTDDVHLEMVFNYNQKDINKETGVVDLVWGSSYATQPPGMYNTAYIPHSVDNFGYPISWYQQNHPDWLEYLCDEKTLAFEFGNKSLAPLDIANPAVQAFQWANWVDAPLAQGYQGIADRGHHEPHQRLGPVRTLRHQRNLGSAIHWQRG